MIDDVPLADVGLQHGMMARPGRDGGILLQDLADAREGPNGDVPIAYATA